MRAVVLLAMLMFVLRGCASDSSDNYSRVPESAASDQEHRAIMSQTPLWRVAVIALQ